MNDTTDLGLRQTIPFLIASIKQMEEATRVLHLLEEDVVRRDYKHIVEAMDLLKAVHESFLLKIIDAGDAKLAKYGRGA
jgi:hypothetical protein